MYFPHDGIDSFLSFTSPCAMTDSICLTDCLVFMDVMFNQVRSESIRPEAAYSVFSVTRLISESHRLFREDLRIKVVWGFQAG